MEYEREQEAAQAKEVYLTSLETTKTYPAHVIEALRCYDDKDINLELVKALLRYICTSMGNGAILVHTSMYMYMYAVESTCTCTCIYNVEL